MTNADTIRDHIRLMTSEDLNRVLSWRNHPDIRRYMYTQHEIPLAEHQCWFEQASQNPHKHLLIFEADDTPLPLGFIQLTQLNDSPVAEWGFYVAPEAPKGAGQRLGRAALKHGFEELGLQKVCGQVLIYNEPSIRLHCTLGFQQEGLLREQHYDGQTYHDVLCFGLLLSEWYSG